MLTLEVIKSEIQPFVSKDSLRPAMNGVLLDFENGCFVATNGYVLLKHKITFDADELPEKMPLKVVVPIGAFPKKKGNETILKFDVKESTPDTKGNTYFFVESISVKEYDSKCNFIENRIIEPIKETFPNYQQVIPEPLPEKTEDSKEWDALYNQKAIQCIGFNWDTFKDISAFLSKHYVKLSFHGQSGAMIITAYGDSEEWEVLVMPTRLRK